MTKLILVAAPSGAGKTSFVDRACREFSGQLMDVVTYTTRPIRRGETQGEQYHFVSHEVFEEMKAQGAFVEWARVHTNFYGTPKSGLEAAWKQGKCAIMDIDIQGVRSILASEFREGAKTVFILPPSIDELRRRIEKRDGAVPVDLDVRMQNAERETAAASSFDVQIVNDDFEVSYAQFKKIIEDWLGVR